MRPISEILPKQELLTFRNDSDFYGASFVAARYAGVRFESKPLYPLWQHGWVPDFWRLHPYFVLGSLRAHQRSEPFLVATKGGEEYLRRHGYRDVRAVGKPLIYLPPARIERIPGSLLVMPAHSFYNKLELDFSKYVQLIDSIRGRFSRVVICISAPCYAMGYWIKDFNDRGYEVIQGAANCDRLAFYRLQTLFSTFEYVTTNGMGSLIPYASYFGAKVSIYGEYYSVKWESFSNSPFTKQYPGLKDMLLYCYSEECARKHLAHLFREPWTASQAVEWGRSELGEDNKISREDMAALFKWRPRDLAVYAVKKFFLIMPIDWRGERMMRLNRLFLSLRLLHSRLFAFLRGRSGR